MRTRTTGRSDVRRKAMIAAVLTAAIVATFVALRTSPDEPGEPVAAVTSAPAARSAPRRTPRRHSSEPVRDPAAEAQQAWDAALVLAKDGKPVEALTLLGPERRESPEFFADPARAKVVAEIEAAALALVARAARGGKLDEARRLVEILTRASIDPARLAAAEDLVAAAERRAAVGTTAQEAGVVARAVSDADKGQLERHLQRFGGEGAPAATDWVDEQLAAVVAANAAWSARKDAVPAAPLPVPDPAEVEVRRLDQLEKLRQRDSVQLLDHIGGALAWLALHQGDDGHFGEDATAARCAALGHDPACVKERSNGLPLAATSLAALAFLDFRDQDAIGLFEPALARAVRWIVRQQKEDGSFGGAERSGYSPGIALMALGQAAAASHEQALKDAVARELAFYAKHAGTGGGFRYALDTDSDLSVTGWYVQAFESATAAGAEAPYGFAAALDNYVASMTKDSVRFGYTSAAQVSSTLAPVGMLSTSILHADAKERLGEQWRDALAKDVPKGNLYGLYYGVRVLLAIDGKLSDPWRDALVELTKSQRAKGPGAGVIVLDRDRWMSQGGSTVTSVFATLTLEHSLYRR